MINYTITLSDTENKALSCIASSPQDWIDNAVHERCRLAIDEIVQLTVKTCLDNNLQIPSTKEAMIDLAIENGWI